MDWELKPDFSANELDWEDDPEKIALDFNYKSFIDGLEDFDYADKGICIAYSPSDFVFL